MTRFYCAPLDRIGAFTYPNLSDTGTITHLGDLDGWRYFHVDDGVPLPTAEGASFQPVELTDDLAARLRAEAPACALPLIVTDGEQRAEHNAPLLEQIAELEARQARPLRELALGIDGARERLLALDNQISALRGQLEA
ncbi:hypothetical protein [Oryzomicrobium sp.]|uniref:hypothetical protein n=1 Tax=Oryzomicrobium sp. TaxID=1911578 RepID=UPI002FE0D986